ncbi:Rv1733c family protein [Amycolatopsis alkalitolerans]|uniref:Transmembrane protein n=1 Tax=Amycolatopsis alkalitolerans TaxID=2547244 RepID=A0A5C4M715_9PSEU|nr:hypothetical protein [Amycolatopsis alkalitolerans]TNC29136.1 hypothetical protein FG385_03315 [Amycolatopsis alkalitolerans]
MARGSASWMLRQLRLLRPGRSALARCWDRIEAVLALLAIGLCLAVIPVAVTIGLDVYNGLSVAARQEKAERHQAIAITKADAPPAETAVTGEQAGVPAVWSGVDGAGHTGRIPVDPATPAGTAEPIWLDRNDEPTIAPLDGSAVVSSAVAAGLFAWICGVLAVAGGLAGGRMLLDNRRAAAWTREWARFSGRPSRP